MKLVWASFVFLLFTNYISCTDLLDEYVKHVEETNKYQQNNIKITKYEPFKRHKRSLETTDVEESQKNYGILREVRDVSSTSIRKAFGNRITLKKLVHTNNSEKKQLNKFPKRSRRSLELEEVLEELLRLKNNINKTASTTVKPVRKGNKKRQRGSHRKTNSTSKIEKETPLSENITKTIPKENQNSTSEINSEKDVDVSKEYLNTLKQNSSKTGTKTGKKSSRKTSPKRKPHNRRQNKNGSKLKNPPKRFETRRPNSQQTPSKTQKTNQNKNTRVISSVINRNPSSNNRYRPKRSILDTEKRKREDNIRHIPMIWTHHEYLDESGDVVLRWQPRHQEIAFRLEARTTGFAAVGFSPSGTIKDADMVVGWLDDNGLVSLVVS